MKRKKEKKKRHGFINLGYKGNTQSMLAAAGSTTTKRRIKKEKNDFSDGEGGSVCELDKNKHG